MAISLKFLELVSMLVMINMGIVLKEHFLLGNKQNKVKILQITHNN
jgi:hypothetical protein